MLLEYLTKANVKTLLNTFISSYHGGVCYASKRKEFLTSVKCFILYEAISQLRLRTFFKNWHHLLFLM